MKVDSTNELNIKHKAKTMNKKELDDKSVIFTMVCHNKDIALSILNDPNKKKYIILFVGKEEITIKNKRLIILRNLEFNIEKEKDLLTFTAWYAIIKNNLFTKYDYICILEYDVILDNSFQPYFLYQGRYATQVLTETEMYKPLPIFN
jgi:hypothetical protein